MVRSVKRVPVKNLTGKLIGTEVNIDPRSPRMTEHSMTLSIECARRWFPSRVIHDFDYADRGPEALSRFLGLAVDEIFRSFRR